MGAPLTDVEEARALAGAARLFGDLLLVELDGDRLRALQGPDSAALLAGVGLAAPACEGQDALDELAARFYAALLRPDQGGAPPVASLWTEGRYEGDIAARLRVLADSAALEFNRDVTRGAPMDHLGSILHLWAASVERAPWVADEIAERHLAWTDACLAQVAASGGFYGDVARVTGDLVAEIRCVRLRSKGAV